MTAEPALEMMSWPSLHAKFCKQCRGLYHLVVKSNVHRRATAQMIEQSLIGITVPTDIVVATPEDIELYKDTIGLIYRPALREGKVIYAA